MLEFEQRRLNFAHLGANNQRRESWQGDFRGKITLQDGISYHVGVRRGIAWDGEEYLSVYLGPELPYFETRRS